MTKKTESIKALGSHVHRQCVYKLLDDTRNGIRIQHLRIKAAVSIMDSECVDIPIDILAANNALNDALSRIDRGRSEWNVINMRDEDDETS